MLVREVGQERLEEERFAVLEEAIRAVEIAAPHRLVETDVEDWPRFIHRLNSPGCALHLLFREALKTELRSEQSEINRVAVVAKLNDLVAKTTSSTSASAHYPSRIGHELPDNCGPENSRRGRCIGPAASRMALPPERHPVMYGT